MSDFNFNSASEREHIFRGHMIKFRKLSSLEAAISARYSECFEAVAALPKAEQKPHLGPLVDLMFRRLKAFAKAGQSLGELIRAIEQAPDYAVQGIDLQALKQTQARIITNAKSMLPKIEHLGTLKV